jgi:16S rRNA (cytosine967-C5)-methyltransferase
LVQALAQAGSCSNGQVVSDGRGVCSTFSVSGLKHLLPTPCNPEESRHTISEIPGLPARLAALKLLDSVFRRGQPLESGLAHATRGITNPADRALAHAIAGEVLRRAPDLDALIDSATRNRLADDAKARMVLRIALAQILSLGTPDHAAIATALPLVDGGPRKLVHGILGTLLRRGVSLPVHPTLLPEVAARWEAAWGGEMVEEASAALAEQPPLDLTLRDPAKTAEWAATLEGESLAPGHVRIARGRAVAELPGYAEGAWWVQNIAASLPARLLGAGEGRAVLDLCAAPGGKTMQLAAAGWNVTAVDQDRARLVRLEDNLSRTGLSATVIPADLLKWEPKAPVPAILLDAPCSATGIFVRHPDVLHRVRPRDIVALADVQSQLIQRAAQWLEPGGTLIYATCSLEPAEGEAQMDGALAAGLTLDSLHSQDVVAGFSPTPKGWLRILPGRGGDGFFIARFKKP